MISYNIICRKDNNFLNLDSLKGKSIIVQNNDRAHVYLKETNLTDNIIIVENIADGIKLLASGQHDAVLSFDVSSFYFVRQKNIHFIKDILCNCVLHSDHSRIVQVITNFLTNAVKFTKEGNITLRTRQIGDNQVEIPVIDSGIGIEKSKLPTVFERFVKLNTCSQGTGLGLSICKNIVEKLGAKSELNQRSIKVPPLG